MTQPLHGPESLFAKLESLGISVETVEHPAVFTVEESQELRGELPGAHSKNLFLRNKKGQMWLVVSIESRQIDLKTLGKVIGAGKVSFGSPDRLMEFLGVIPGSVTPFAAINDENNAVQVVLDSGFLDFDRANFHPLVNTMTSAIAPKDLLAFLEAVGHPASLLDLGNLEALLPQE